MTDQNPPQQHTPPPEDARPPGGPYGTPKTPPGQTAPGTENPYTTPPQYPPHPQGSPYQQGPYQPGHPAAQPPLAPGEERNWALAAHLSFFVLSVIGPLIVLLVFGKRSAFVRVQSTEALNFHLTLLIACLVSIPLMFLVIGFVTFFAALIYGMVMSVIAAVRISDGFDYRYPLNFRMVS